MIISKNTRILVLMVLSQLMLIGLSAHWLTGQFNDAKVSLYDEIENQFTASIDQVLDSMLTKHLIKPVLFGKSEQIFHDKKNCDTVITRSSLASKQITTIFNDSGNKKNTLKFFTIDDTMPESKRSHITLRVSSDNKKDMLLRSVKLIIHQAYDTMKTGNDFKRIISNAPDTTLLKTVFDGKLQKKGILFSTKWITNSTHKPTDKKQSNFYFESRLFEKNFGAEVSRFDFFLLKQISSQVLFIIILLIMTGATFFMMYKNMKNMETLNIMRNEFISNISHELKTPVSTVKLTLEVLKNFDRIKDPVVTREYLDIATLEMNRLDQLISKVLNTSVLESQKTMMSFEKTNLRPVVDEVLRSMHLTITKRNAEVIFKPDEDEYFADLDKLYILGVIINLIDNSLKYGPDLPKILIKLEKNTSSVILSVSDNGPGIPEEYHPKVFDKFFRVPSGDLHNVKGYGLGLSFAAQVMKHHQGSISLKNLPEGGCVFLLHFPKSKI